MPLPTLMDRPAGEALRAVLGWWLGELAGIAEALDRRPRGSAVAVPAEWILLRELRLPFAARQGLATAVAAEIDRITPFSADAVLYTWHERARIGGEIVLDLAVLPRHKLEPLLADRAGAGSPATRIRAAEPAPSWLRGHNFLRRDGAALPGGLSGMAAALLALALLAPLAAEQYRDFGLENRLAAAKRDAAEARRLARELASRRSGQSELDVERAGRPRVSLLLAELSETLPKDAYLDMLTFEGGTLSLSGHAASAAGLIGVLSREDRFTDVRFSGSVTRDAEHGLERFEITASYAPKAYAPTGGTGER